MSANVIAIFKLISGDELVGRLIDEDDTHFMIEKPLAVAIMRDERGQPGKALMPWLLLEANSQILAVYKDKLLISPVGAAKEVSDAWLQQTSGIVLTGAQLNG